MKDTTENNKLIAEFLGWELKTIPFEVKSKGWFSGEVYQCEMGSEIFDTSWDWLMPVVEKIQEILIKYDSEFCIEFYKEIISDELLTYVSVGNNPKIETENKTPIKAVYQAVIKFIEWYNKNAA